MNVFADINLIRFATEGSLCGDRNCRRTDAGRTSCGSKRCDQGHLDNGVGALQEDDRTFIADMKHFGDGDERNHPLAALSRIFASANAGNAAFCISEYQEGGSVHGLAAQLTAVFGAEAATETILELRVVSATSRGKVISEAAAKAMTRDWVSDLSREDRFFLFEDKQRNGKPRIDHEDAVLVSAMLLSGEPATLVTEDAGFLAAGLRLAALFSGIYIVDAQTYADPVRYLTATRQMDVVHARMNDRQLAGV